MPNKTISASVSNQLIDLTVGKVKKLSGLGLEVSQKGKARSARTGSLIKSSSRRSKGSDDFGAFEETGVVYKQGRSQAATLRVRCYPGQAAACVFVEYDHSQPPDAIDGLRVDIGELPGFVRAHGARIDFCWTKPFFVDDPGDVSSDTQFLLWEVKSGRMGCCIPLCGDGLRGLIKARDGLLGVNMSSHCDGHRPQSVPVMAVGFGHDPYKLVEKVYKAGMAAMGRPGRLRSEKARPEMFDYFGWCSWNAFYGEVTQQKILSVMNGFKRSDFPVRWVLVDDGWSPVNDGKLSAFEADPAKFPHGIKAFSDELKRDYDVSWVGVWHTFQGYWKGVDPDSDLGREYADVLFEGEGGVRIPQPVGQAGFRFFLDWHSALRQWGIDFIKVDNQSTMQQLTKDRLPVFDAMRQQQYSLQASANVAFQNRIINCMGMASESAYCWLTSAVARNSDDYQPDREENPQSHARQNAYNSLWLSQLAVPDFDMFQSHHPQSEYHAVLRAVSGGPVYVTDEPDRQDWSVLRKLCFKGGLLPMPDAPAAPTADVLFVDPQVEKVPLKVFTRAGEAGIVAAFNVREDDAEVEGTVGPEDAQLKEGHRYAVYEHFSGEMVEAKDKTRLPVTLGRHGVKLYIFEPIHEGFAPIGLVNKYIAPRGILSVAETVRGLRVVLREGGQFVAWLAGRPSAVRVDGKTLLVKNWNYQGNTFRAHIPDKRSATEPVVVEIALKK